MSDVNDSRYEPTQLPYRIAVLCYLWSGTGDPEDRILMLHRAKEPNTDMYSPIGGKVEVSAEKAYQGEMHGLLFLFETVSPVNPSRVENLEFDEGVLEWVKVEEVQSKNIPQTDRDVLWPLVRKHRQGGFFMIDIDCSGDELTWRMVQEHSG